MARLRKMPSSALSRRKVRPVRAKVKRPTAASRVPGASRAPRKRPTAHTRRERKLRKEGQPFLRAAQNRYGRSQRRKKGYTLNPGESEAEGFRRYSHTTAQRRAGRQVRPRSPQMGPPGGGISQPGGPGPIVPGMMPNTAPLMGAYPPPGPVDGMMPRGPLERAPLPPGPPLGLGPEDVPGMLPKSGAYGGGANPADGFQPLDQPSYEELLRWYLMMQSRNAGVGGAMGV